MYTCTYTQHTYTHTYTHARCTAEENIRQSFGDLRGDELSTGQCAKRLPAGGRHAVAHREQDPGARGAGDVRRDGVRRWGAERKGAWRQKSHHKSIETGSRKAKDPNGAS